MNIAGYYLLKKPNKVLMSNIPKSESVNHNLMPIIGGEIDATRDNVSASLVGEAIPKSLDSKIPDQEINPKSTHTKAKLALGATLLSLGVVTLFVPLSFLATVPLGIASFVIYKIATRDKAFSKIEEVNPEVEKGFAKVVHSLSSSFVNRHQKETKPEERVEDIDQPKPFRRILSTMKSRVSFYKEPEEANPKHKVIETEFWKYDGEMENGMRNGEGILITIDHKDKTFESIYVGQFKDDLFDGPGKLQLKNGTLEGIFKQGHYIGLEDLQTDPQ